LRSHYVFDLSAEVWRKKIARGDMIIVRYADDLVAGFQHRADAERFLKEFQERLAKFGLEVHPDKTRLIAFGREAWRNRKREGQGSLKRSRSWSSRTIAERTRKAIFRFGGKRLGSGRGPSSSRSSRSCAVGCTSQLPPPGSGCSGWYWVTTNTMPCRGIYSNRGVSAGGWLDCGGMSYAVGVRSHG
jgi:hypothetical protein